MKNAKKPLMFTIAEFADLLGVTGRQVRNWITDSGLQTLDLPGVTKLDGRAAIAWYTKKAIADFGNSGNRRADGGAYSPDFEEESYDTALARKTRAEADLKELQLARERGEVAAIADVEKALGSANAATKTLIQALPSRLATQLLGIDDRIKLHAILERETNGLLSNLASVATVIESGARRPVEDDEE